MNRAVDQQQLSQWADDFSRDGHVYLENYFEGAAFDDLSQNIERYIRDVVPRLPATHAFFENPDDPATLKQMQHMQEEDSYFYDLIRRDDLLTIASALLDDDAVPQGAEYFNKPAGIGTATPPHQDGYYFCLVPNNAVTFWIALDFVNEENGCLRYVSGSHRDGVRPHGASKVLGFSQGLQDWGPADEQRETISCLAPGDVLVHHSLTVHRAEANTSNRSRRALGLVYFGKEAKVDRGAQQNYETSLNQQHTEMGVVKS